MHLEIENKVIKERLDLYALVENSHIHNAVVLMDSGTSVIRPMLRGDLTRNGISLTGDVLFGFYLDEESYGKIKKYFPNKDVYRYIRESDSVNGKLIKLM